MNYQQLRISITNSAASTIGTSARLTYGSWMTVQDLLYGLMLPSGNDAALALAQAFGLLLEYQERHRKDRQKLGELAQAHSIDMAIYERDKPLDRLVKLFVAEMNAVVEGLGLADTFLTNPHGLSDPDN